MATPPKTKDQADGANADATNSEADKATPEPPKADATTVAERHVRHLEGYNLSECEFKRTVWVATTHEGTIPEDMLKPEYWAHVAEKFRPFDRIEVRAYDGTWFAEYLVTEASRVWAKVHPLSLHVLTTADVSLSQATDYEVSYRGPGGLWSIIRKSDRKLMLEGKQTQSAAYTALAELVKA